MNPVSSGSCNSIFASRPRRPEPPARPAPKFPGERAKWSKTARVTRLTAVDRDKHTVLDRLESVYSKMIFSDSSAIRKTAVIPPDSFPSSDRDNPSTRRLTHSASCS